MQYTIKNITATGKEDPKFGVEYLVNFNEDGRVVRMNRKYPPKVGSTLIGDIIDSRYGAYFKKDPNAQPSAPSSSPSPKAYDKNYSMFLSYAKDLMIAYMNAINWDFSKVNEQAFGELLATISTTAHTLQDSEKEESEPKTDIVYDPFSGDIL